MIDILDLVILCCRRHFMGPIQIFCPSATSHSFLPLSIIFSLFSFLIRNYQVPTESTHSIYVYTYTGLLCPSFVEHSNQLLTSLWPAVAVLYFPRLSSLYILLRRVDNLVCPEHNTSLLSSSTLLAPPQLLHVHTIVTIHSRPSTLALARTVSILTISNSPLSDRQFDKSMLPF
jgi:hypothetical protein